MGILFALLIISGVLIALASALLWYTGIVVGAIMFGFNFWAAGRLLTPKRERRTKMPKKYQVIYADPPWRYDFSKSDSRQVENQYPTMSLEEIKALQVPAADNSVLYLWATAPELLESLAVLESWGFCYKTHAIWDKVTMGMGYWFRGQHELLLVGVKGHFSPPEQKLRIPSIIAAKRTNHSAKPDIVRTLIQIWYPNTAKLELFARQEAAGWDCWGNEVASAVELGARKD